jgi:uncharacterized glyoxalase superfamily protein PhnB
MAKRSLSQQLDDAVEAIVQRPGAATPPPAPVDDRLAPLVRLASLLCDLPSERFRAGLKAALIRRASMPTATVDYIRKGFHTITPYLTVHKAAELIDFVKGAFGAAELMRGGPGSQGGIHCEVRIGDSMLMIGGGGAWRGTPMPTALHLYVPDADAVYRRAVAAGATSVRVPVDQPYGDREATVEDLAGNHWYVATHLGGHHIPEGLRTVTPFLHPRGADQFIDFLKRGFGALETACFRSPDGNIAHAVMTIGDSVVEMGEAHGDAQPRPTMFYLYVDDVDVWHERALGAGANLLSPPADQPYGDRVGAVTDPIGNMWYLATHIKDAAS